MNAEILSNMRSSLLPKSRWLFVLAILGGLVLLLGYRYNSQVWTRGIECYNLLFDRHRLKEAISSFGPYSPLAYILIQILQVVVAPIPGGAVEFMGGYLFGVNAGFFYSMIGLVIGSWLAFSLARMFERWVVENSCHHRPERSSIIWSAMKGSSSVFFSFSFRVFQRMPSVIFWA